MKTIVILVFGTILFGLLNIIFHCWTDWYLGLYIGKLYGFDLSYSSNWHSNIILLNSLYSGPRLGLLTLFQMLLIMTIAGFYTTNTIIELYKNKKVSRKTLIIFLIVWLLKIPVTIDYSNFKDIWKGLLAY